MLEKITQILRDYKDDQELEITEQASFAELGLDSLDTVELIMSIEDEFSVVIEVNEGIKTVGDLIRIIESKQ